MRARRGGSLLYLLLLFAPVPVVFCAARNCVPWWNSALFAVACVGFHHAAPFMRRAHIDRVAVCRSWCRTRTARSWATRVRHRFPRLPCLLRCAVLCQLFCLRRISLDVFAAAGSVVRPVCRRAAAEITVCSETHPSLAVSAVAAAGASKCASCDIGQNLWLCLTCGALGCPRKQYGDDDRCGAGYVYVLCLPSCAAFVLWGLG